jgi:hypothetical protein
VATASRAQTKAPVSTHTTCSIAVPPAALLYHSCMFQGWKAKQLPADKPTPEVHARATLTGSLLCTYSSNPPLHLSCVASGASHPPPPPSPAPHKLSKGPFPSTGYRGWPPFPWPTYFNDPTCWSAQQLLRHIIWPGSTVQQHCINTTPADVRHGVVCSEHSHDVS